MPTSTNVPPLNFGAAGVVAPSESQVLAGVLTDMNAAFGGGLNTQNLSTPQGQLASSLAAIVGDKNATLMRYVNQVDPLYAQGRMQDAIGRIYFLDRKPAEPTVVAVTCIGVAGVSIPVGALVSDTVGNVYACTQAGIIPPSGSIDLQFANQQTGPIPCPAGTITSIYQSITGWDKAFNYQDGVIGNDVESAAEFEFRRKNSVALNARGSLPSIYANVFAVPDVLDVFAVENTSSLPMSSGVTAYVLTAHSIYVAVVGGDPQAIAEAIWRKKDVGADYNGNTTVTVEDTSYDPPRPTYKVKFNIPLITPVRFAVQISANLALPANIVQLVQQAVVSAFAGADGGARARIGGQIFASRFYAPVKAVDPNVQVVSVLLGIASPASNVLTMGIDQFPVVSATDIAVSLV